MKSTDAPSISDRVAILRERILDRKAARVNVPNWKAAVDARSLKETEKVKSWQIRMGQRTRARLENIRFEFDDLELMAGRISHFGYGFSEKEIAESEKYLSAYKWPCGQTGHCALDMSRIFKVGITGVFSEIQERLGKVSGDCKTSRICMVNVRHSNLREDFGATRAICDRHGCQGLDGSTGSKGSRAAAEKRDTYKSFMFALLGLSQMIENAKASVARAADAAPEWRKAELEEIIASCERIKTGPPKTFRDAIQLMWFVISGVSLADNAGLVVPGHLDRELISFYENDIREGVIAKEDALNLIESLYLLINDYIPDGLAISVMAGGRDEHGRDVTNELSYLSLEALRRTKLVYPTVGVCWHEGTPKELSMLACELISKGYSTPAFFGDETIQKGLKYYGLDAAQACNYINSTCVEITPVSCSNVWVASPYFSLCRILLDEIAAQASAARPAAKFEAFLSAYYRRLAKEIKEAVKLQNEWRGTRRKFGRKPLQSVFTKSCIEKGHDIDDGGADVNWVECSFVGIANLADSLQVIRDELFASKSIDFSALKKILDSDFEGCEGVRLRFLEGHEKYGNNSPDVDAFVERTSQFVKAECAKHKVRPGKTHFIPGTFCWIMHQVLGSQCGATPDGRRKGFPFADGGGPAQGREKKGPTSSILSTTSWDHSFLIGGLAYNMKFSGELFNSSESVERLHSLIVTFLKRGGFETQINVVSRKILEDAKKNPEQYRDLVVRIGGYTDYFTRLSPEMKEEVMLRTEHKEL